MPRSAAVLLLALLLPAGCAQSPAGPQPAASGAAAPPPPIAPGDPLEATNRRVLDFNLGLDDCCIRPLALGYRRAVHPWVRARIRNVVHNIQEPRHAANALLQGDPRAAGETAMRFVINSTFGLAGMFDLEPVGGPPRRERDFGQTLHAWGVPDGPYLMLPVVGPSNPRDTVGTVADGLLNPVTWLMPFWGNVARGGVDGLDLRERNVEGLDALRSESLDFYARLRSVWQQRRAAELGRGGREAEEGLDVLDDPAAALPSPAGGGSAAPPPSSRGGGGRPGAGGAAGPSPRAGAAAGRPGAYRTPAAAVRTATRARVPARAPSTAAMAPSRSAAKAQ
jgi:phospholipid-binding lipoprotein MlaA